MKGEISGEGLLMGGACSGRGGAPGGGAGRGHQDCPLRLLGGHQQTTAQDAEVSIFAIRVHSQDSARLFGRLSSIPGRTYPRGLWVWRLRPGPTAERAIFDLRPYLWRLKTAPLVFLPFPLPSLSLSPTLPLPPPLPLPIASRRMCLVKGQQPSFSCSTG